MYYVYLLQSLNNQNKHYVGFSENLKKRFIDHNLGKSKHTSKDRPWRMMCYFAFSTINKAKKFEHYLKTGSGRAFCKRHFL